MMADETRRIAHLVGTTAQGAAGGGRKGLLMHDTDIGTLKMQLDAEGTYASYARRDAAQTFSGKQTFSDASFTALAGGGASPLPVARNDDGELVPRTASEFREDIGAQPASDAVVKTPTESQTITGYPLLLDRAAPNNDAFSATVIGDTVRRFLIAANGDILWGDGATARALSLKYAAAHTLGVDGGILRASYGLRATNYSSAYNAAEGGTGIEVHWNSTYGRVMAYDRDNSLYMPLRSVGSMYKVYVGSAGNILAQDVDASGNHNFGGALSIGGSQFLSVGKALDVISAKVTGLAGTGTRPVVTDASGNVSAQDAATFRTTIGAQASGSYQPLDATLTALSGLATGADKLAYSTGTDVFSQTSLTAFARTILDDADEAAVRATIGAQEALDFTPVNRAGDLDMTGLMTFLDVGGPSTTGIVFKANGTGACVGLNIEGYSSRWQFGSVPSADVLRVRKYSDAWSSFVSPLEIGADYIDSCNNYGSPHFRVLGTKVIGPRKTGWTPWTGTASRATRATRTTVAASSTYTQAESTAMMQDIQYLMQCVKALIDDLHATAGHGLIGT